MTTLTPMTQPNVPLVAEWLARPENHRWLDFGRGRQVLDAVALTMMRQSPANHVRIIRDDDQPIGVVALAEINPVFRTAILWYVLGEAEARGRGHASRAVIAVLAEAFGELELQAVQAWVVEGNVVSQRVLEKAGFRSVGRLRSCHMIEGRSADRLLFDRLSTDA